LHTENSERIWLKVAGEGLRKRLSRMARLSRIAKRLATALSEAATYGGELNL